MAFSPLPEKRKVKPFRFPFGRPAPIKIPVLAPTVIPYDDGSGSWELVHRRRARCTGDASPVKTPSPGIHGSSISKFKKPVSGRVGRLDRKFEFIKDRGPIGHTGQGSGSTDRTQGRIDLAHSRHSLRSLLGFTQKL